MHASLKKIPAANTNGERRETACTNVNIFLSDSYIYTDSSKQTRKELGQGSYGKVYECKRKDTPKQRYAVKVVPFRGVGNSLESFLEEIELLKKIQSVENVVRFVDKIQDKRNIYIVTELCTGGGLDDYFLSEYKDRKHMREDEIKEIIYTICKTMSTCHQDINVAHRDLKLQNMVFQKDENGAPKGLTILDFGLAKQFESCKNDTMTTPVGTKVYMAPELLKNIKWDKNDHGQGKSDFGRKVDVWSVGVMAHRMLTGVFPFQNVQEIVKGYKVDNALWAQKGKNAKSFVKYLLTAKPDKRYETIICASRESWHSSCSISL